MSDIDLDDVPAETPLSPDEAIQRRHRKEKKELQGKILAMKKTTKNDKKKKKELADEIAKLEGDMESRHKSELAAFRPQRQDVPTANNVISMTEVKDVLINEVIEKPSNPECSQVESHDEDAEITGHTVKLSKAQKRREKKAALEKERQIRVETETALLLEDADWKIEDNKLVQILHDMDLEVFDIPSDGHCLYRAVAHQLHRCNESLTVDELRNKTAQYLLANKQDFVNYLDETESDSPKEYEAYCKNIETTAAWGGQIELRALSQLLKRPIKVIQADGPPLLFGEEFSAEVLVLTYHRYKFKLGAHYNSVIPANLDDGIQDGEFQRA